MNHLGHRAGLGGTSRSRNPCSTRSQLSIMDHLQGNVPSRMVGGICPCWAQEHSPSSTRLTLNNSNSCCTLGILSTLKAELICSRILWQPQSFHFGSNSQVCPASAEEHRLGRWLSSTLGTHPHTLTLQTLLPPSLSWSPFTRPLHCAMSKLPLNQHPAEPQPLALSQDTCKPTGVLQRETHAWEKSLQPSGLPACLSTKQGWFQAISYCVWTKTFISHSPSTLP